MYCNPENRCAILYSVPFTGTAISHIFIYRNEVILSETLPIGTVYPVWTGIGAVGAVIVGIIFFGEPATFWRIFFITTLILSIIGLKVLA